MRAYVAVEVVDSDMAEADKSRQAPPGAFRLLSHV